LGGPANAQLRFVTAVRHWTVGSVTRIAVEVSGDFEIRSDRLHNPERIYFDIHDSRPQFGSPRAYTEDVGDPLLKRVAIAETAPGVRRIVLDWAEGVEATPSQLTNPSRLMIELRRGVPTDAPPPQVISMVVPLSPTPPVPAPSTPAVLPPAPKVPLSAVTSE